MKITNLRLRELTGSFDFDGEFWEERLSRPIDVYPEYKAQGPVPGFWLPHKVEEGRYQIRSVVLQIETDEGVYGLSGMVAHDIAYIIDQQFRGLLIGKDPRASERLWDMMYREAVHGRKGPTMIAISAIDCALWDLKGRWLGQPVYRLLGGPIRETVPAYASMLGYSLEPEKVRQRAREVAEQGYTATKWFARHYPTDGWAGSARSVAWIADLRWSVGPDVDVVLLSGRSLLLPYPESQDMGIV